MRKYLIIIFSFIFYGIYIVIPIISLTFYKDYSSNLISNFLSLIKGKENEILILAGTSVSDKKSTIS
jgi:hypothetical protein